MGKRTMLVLGMGALLSGSACGLLEPDDGCEGTSNTVQTIRGDTSITRTGLRFVEIRFGTGTSVRSCRTVGISYVGSLANGNEFDRGNLFFVPGAGDLIDGFEQGVIGMKVGGVRRLIVPPELGYGAVDRTDNAGTVVIPANSTLVFDIEALQAQ